MMGLYSVLVNRAEMLEVVYGFLSAAAFLLFFSVDVSASSDFGLTTIVSSSSLGASGSGSWVGGLLDSALDFSSKSNESSLDIARVQRRGFDELDSE